MKVFYLRDASNFPVACVMADRVDTSHVKFVVATWNPLDRFSKKKGRFVAQKKMDGGAIFGIVNIEPRFTKWNIINCIAWSKMTPARTKKAADLWLDTFSERTRLTEEKEDEGHGG